MGITLQNGVAKIHPWAGFEYVETVTRNTPPVFNLADGSFVPRAHFHTGYTITLKGTGVESCMLPERMYESPFYWASQHFITETYYSREDIQIQRDPVLGSLRVTDVDDNKLPFTYNPTDYTIDLMPGGAPVVVKVVYQPIFLVLLKKYLVQHSNTDSTVNWELTMEEIFPPRPSDDDDEKPSACNDKII